MASEYDEPVRPSANDEGSTAGGESDAAEPGATSDTDNDGVAGEATPAPVGAARLAGYLAVYTLLRIGLVVALTAMLAFFMPLIVALLFAIIVQLPLSWLIFAGPRRRVNDAIAQTTGRRRSERARLQSALSGDEPG